MRSLALLLVLAVAAAGCTMPGSGDTTTTSTSPTGSTSTTTTTMPPVTTTPPVNDTPVLTNATWTVSTTGIPAQAKPGVQFNFTLDVNGTTTFASQHIGGHFADNTTSALVPAAMKACDHQAGQLPGTFNISCTMADEGTWYLYGHAQAIQNETFNYWALPSAVKVRNYTLNLTGAPGTPLASNQSFTLNMNVTGKDNATSDHIGAHWFNATTNNPTPASSAGNCALKTGSVIDVHAVKCAIPNTGTGPKTFFVYGHVRIVEGGVTLDWWSAPVEVQVLGTAGLPI